MNMPDIVELRRIATLCRAAEGPDRTIDVLAWIQIGWTEGGDEQLAWRNGLPLAPESVVNGTDLATAAARFPKDHRGIARNWYIPELSASTDAATSILGRPEDPFVLMTQTDFGGLRRARIFDGNEVSTGADADTLPLAILAAGLEALADRIKLGLALPDRD